MNAVTLQHWRHALLGACATALLWPLAPLAADADPLSSEPLEARLLAALDQVQQADIDTALADLRALIDESPNFRLAQLIYGDLLLARSRPIATLGNSDQAGTQSLASLREEALVRWQHHQVSPSLLGFSPPYLMALAPRHRHVILVDLGQSRLYLYENVDGSPRLVANYYISMGQKGPVKQVEGDQRTPIGVYFVTEFLPGEQLPDLYGHGAFPIDYPNAWDRRQGKTGYGIWLHGTPSNTYSRPPRASNGCVVLTNTAFDALAPYVDATADRTPVVIYDSRLESGTTAQASAGQDLQAAIAQWRRDWESRDSERYLAHYAEDFAAPGHDLTSWRRHKTRVNGQKAYIRVGVSELSAFAYPGESDLALVTFEQDYDSDNHRSQSSKQQFWRRGADGRWRIIYEGPA